MRNDFPIYAVSYIGEFCKTLNARRFAVMRLSGDALTICDTRIGANAIQRLAYDKTAAVTEVVAVNWS